MTAGPPIVPDRRRLPLWQALLAASVITLPIGLTWLGVVDPSVCMVSVVVLIGLLLARLREHASAIMLVFSGVMLVSTIVTDRALSLAEPVARGKAGADLAAEWSTRETFDDDLPIVVHVLLDELMSPGAIDLAMPGGRQLQDQMRALGETHRLRLFDAVYGRHFLTHVGVPNMMNAEFTGRTAVGDYALEPTREVTGNAYFRHMADRGYRTAVFQSDVLHYCESPDVRLCETFSSYDPAAGRHVDLEEARAGAVYLWDAVLTAYQPSHLSNWGRWLVRKLFGLDQRALGVLGAANRFDVQGFSAWFDRFSAFTSGVPRGTHVFAHFLVPHSPYLLTSDCVVSGTTESGYYLHDRFATQVERAAARRRFYPLYFEQAACALSKIDGLLQALAAKPRFADATILIHGDHGARISSGDLADRFTDRDLVDNYATFFALRAPGIDAGTDCTLQSLPQAFAAAIDGPPAVMRPPLPVIASTSAGQGAVVERAMPSFGCAAR